MEKGIKDGDKNTTVLYKKSLSSIRRHSRTSSLRAQSYLKGDKQRSKLRSSREHMYYNDGSRIKRDLSIETDICKMRNHLRRGVNKDSYQDVASLKSKYSTFADGDSLLGREESETRPLPFQNADVVSLIVDNFRNLLNKWIREYLLDSSDNLQKIEAIRESLLRKLDKGMNQASRSTNLSRSSWQRLKMHNRRKARMRSQCLPKDKQKCEPNCSNYTVPFQSKQFRLISTLSLPRNIDNPALKCKEKLRKVNCQQVFFAFEQPKERLADSTFILVTMSSRSFTKHCVNYNEYLTNKPHEPSVISFQVKNTRPFNNSLCCDHCSKMEYNDDTKNVPNQVFEEIHTAIKIIPKDDKDTMTDLCYQNRSTNRVMSSHHNPVIKRRSSKRLQKYKTYVSNVNNIKYKQFTYLYRKAGKKNSPSDEFVHHFQDILNYIDTYGGKRNIRLDVHVNVLPGENPESYTQNVHENCEHQLNIATNKLNCGNLDTLMEFRESESSTTKESKSFESENLPEIISLLDGSESKGRYIANTGNSSVEAANTEQNSDNSESTFLDNKLNICQQIVSLKDVIKGLTITAEKLIVEHMRDRLDTSSRAIQVGTSQCDAAVEMVDFSQNTSIPKTRSYAWFAQNPVIYNTIPEVTKQLMNSELENCKMSMKLSELNAVPDPNSSLTSESDKISKPVLQKEMPRTLSKGIQFSCNLGQNNTGLKLQTQSKITPDTFHSIAKKPSVCYIESESVLKVTDMTSKDEIPTYTKVKEVGLTCSFPSSPLNVEVNTEKETWDLSPFNQNSVKLYQCGDFNKRESTYVHLEHQCRCNTKTSTLPYQSSEVIKKLHNLDQEKSVEECEQNKSKPCKTKCKKYWKLFHYGILLCIPLVIFILASFYFTDAKGFWEKTIYGKTEVIKSNITSDLRSIMSDFGF